MAKQSNHWGDWILARSRVVGFRRLLDLAKAVGCTPERITQWASMAAPPKRMPKGFDRSLASALATTSAMLFSDWDHTAPESAERLGQNVAVGGMITTIAHAREATEFAGLGLLDNEQAARIHMLLLAESKVVDTYYDAFRAGDYGALTKARAAIVTAAATTSAELEKLRIKRFFEPDKSQLPISSPASKLTASQAAPSSSAAPPLKHKRNHETKPQNPTPKHLKSQKRSD